jgi:hypothetical protein
MKQPDYTGKMQKTVKVLCSKIISYDARMYKLYIQCHTYILVTQKNGAANQYCDSEDLCSA